jgi:hypothetical protein
MRRIANSKKYEYWVLRNIIFVTRADLHFYPEYISEYAIQLCLNFWFFYPDDMCSVYYIPLIILMCLSKVPYFGYKLALKINQSEGQ